jgi:serine/threonine protein phosphatase PrpC
MHGMEAKKEMKKTPVDIDVFISQQLVKLTSAAYAAAKTEEARGEIRHDSKPGPLGLNRRQAKKYRIYEFSFGPDDLFEEDIKNIFNQAFPENPLQAFNNLQQLLPDGIKLFYTSEAASHLPRYEFHGRTILLSIKLAAEKLLLEHEKNERIREIISKRLHKKWEIATHNLESLYSELLTGCWFKFSGVKPRRNHLDELKIPSNATYLKYDRQFYYINKLKKACILLNLSGQQQAELEKVIGVPDSKIKQFELSEQQLKKIGKITNCHSFSTPKRQFTRLKEIIYLFQNEVRVELVDILSAKNIPTKENLEEISQQILEYEQTTRKGIAPELAAEERELNADLFRLHEHADGRLQFQNYFRHFPISVHQKQRVESKALVSKENKYEQKYLADVQSPLLYPTQSAHSDGQTLPNFAKMVEGTADNKFLEITVAFSGFRHGTPFDLRKPIKKMTRPERETYKHDSLFQVYLNYCQELLIIRAQKLQALFFEYNASVNRPKMPVDDIQKLSLELSTYISEELDEKLLAGYIDIAHDPIPILKRALMKTNILEKYKKIENFLYGCINDIFLAQNFYTHIISGHDDTHLVGDNAGLLQWGGFIAWNRGRFWKEPVDDEAPQFRACRIAQYALDYSEKNFGMGYLCLPLNFPDKSIKIIGNIRSALIQAFFKLQAAFPEDKMIESVSQLLKDSILFKRYYLYRGEVTKAAKKYLAACKPGTRKKDDELDQIRKNEFKPAEKQFFSFLESSPDEKLSNAILGIFAVINPFKTLSDAVAASKSSTVPGMILQVIFQIFDNGEGEWTGKFNGVIPALFQFLTHAIRDNSDVAVAASGGCKSGNDRWQRVILILTDIVTKGVDSYLLEKLNQALQEFGDDIAYNLSRVHTALEGSCIPKTQNDKLAFKKLKSDAKISKTLPYKIILEVTNDVVLFLTAMPPHLDVIEFQLGEFRSAYIRYRDQLFYFDKNSRSLEEITSINIIDFDNLMKIGKDEKGQLQLSENTEQKDSHITRLTSQLLHRMRTEIEPGHQRPDFIMMEKFEADLSESPAMAINRLIKDKRSGGDKRLGPLSGATGTFAEGAIGFYEIVGSRYLYERQTMQSPIPPAGQQDGIYMGYLEKFPTEEKEIIQFFLKQTADIHEHLESKFPAVTESKSGSLLNKAGCTFISLVVDTTEESFSLGNMGDSTFFLVTEVVKEYKDDEEKEYKIELINELDKPDHPEEAKRAALEGGIITPASSRDCARLGGLAITAAFGDKLVTGIRKTPKVKAGIKYPPNSYGILACDGLAEKFSEEEIKAFLINHIKEAKGVASPQSAAHALTGEAFRKGSTDNISTLVIDFNKLKALNPGKIIQLAVGDGHGPDADKISHAACAALKPIQAPEQRAENQEYSFNHKSQCLTFDKLAVHKRREKFNKEEHGWISEEEFIKLWSQKIPDFHTWYHGISPAIKLWKIEISQLFYAHCHEKLVKGQSILYKEKLLAALKELKHLPETERLAKKWLEAYFQRENILAAIEAKDKPVPNNSNSDDDSDSSQETETDDEVNKPRIDHVEMALFPRRQRDAKLSIPTRSDSPSDFKLSGQVNHQDLSQSEVIPDMSEIPEFIKQCQQALPELLPDDKELIPILIKARGKKLTPSEGCEIIFMLIDKAYQLKIKSVNSSSLLAHSSNLSKVCNCLLGISVSSPIKFYSNLSSVNVTIRGLYIRLTPQAAVEKSEELHAEL